MAEMHMDLAENILVHILYQCNLVNINNLLHHSHLVNIEHYLSMDYLYCKYLKKGIVFNLKQYKNSVSRKNTFRKFNLFFERKIA